MNLAEFLGKSKLSRITQKSSLEELSLLIKPAIKQIEKKTDPILVAENSLQKLQQKLTKQESFELKKPEEILPMLKKQLYSAQSVDNYIKNLAGFNENKTIELKPSRRYKQKKKVVNIFKINETPIEYEFKSKPNNIKVYFLDVIYRKKQAEFPNEFIMDIEDINSLSDDFKSIDVEIKPVSKRYSIQKVTGKSVSILETTRGRIKTITTTTNLKPILSESSSSSSSEDLPTLYSARQAAFLKRNYTKTYNDLELLPITNKDYKLSGSKPLTFITPQEISNGEAVKFGYLLKRIGDKNKFHKR